MMGEAWEDNSVGQLETALKKDDRVWVERIMQENPAEKITEAALGSIEKHVNSVIGDPNLPDVVKAQKLREGDTAELNLIGKLAVATGGRVRPSNQWAEGFVKALAHAHESDFPELSHRKF